MRNFSIRIVTDIVILVSFFVFPWWFSLLLAISSLFIFDNYFEALFFGFLLDTLYGSTHFSLLKVNVLFTLICAGTFVISFFAKRNLSVYSS